MASQMSSQAPTQIKEESKDATPDAHPASVNLKVKQQVVPFPLIVISADPNPNAFQDGSVTHFKIKVNTQMKKAIIAMLHAAFSLNLNPKLQLFENFCVRHSLDIRSTKYVQIHVVETPESLKLPSLRFLFEGNTLHPEVTPDDLGAC